MKAACLLVVLSLAGCEREAAKAPETEPETETDSLPFEPVTVDGVLDAETKESPLVAVSREAISVNGTPVIKLRAGAVETNDLEHGALSLTIPGLVDALAKLPKAPSVRVLLHREVSFDVLYKVLVSSARAKRDVFELVAASGGKRGMIPMTLPTHAPAAAASADEPCPDPAKLTPGAELLAATPGSGARVRIGQGCPGESPVGLVLSVLEDRAILWSVSGLEGTLQKPALVLGADDEKIASVRDATLARWRTAVRAALAEIIARRGGAKAPGPREMILQCDRRIDAETALRWMAAVRHDADGTPLFTAVLLAAGFE